MVETKVVGCLELSCEEGRNQNYEEERDDSCFDGLDTLLRRGEVFAIRNSKNAFFLDADSDPAQKGECMMKRELMMINKFVEKEMT